MNTVLKYPGSKWSMTDWIIGNFPPGYEKMTYVEPFGGSLAVFFNKNRSVIETVNDLDSRVTNLFKVLREQPQELARLIKLTPWSRQEYKQSYEMTGNDLEDARRFMVRMWQAIGSKTSDITGWRNNIQDLNGNVNQWTTKLLERLVEVSSRLMHTKNHQVNIENQDAFKLLERYARPYCFVYADPPYVRSTRSNRLYKHEMIDDQQHIELLNILKKHPGPAMLSGYDNDIYNNLLEGWHKEYFNANCEGGKSRTEVLWMNYEPDKRQLDLFES